MLHAKALLLATVLPLAVASTQGPAAAPPAVVVHDDLQYAEGFARDPRRNRLDLYVPTGAAKAPVVLLAHGGGWTGGSKEVLSGVAHALAAHGFVTASINMQLRPFAKAPAIADDVAHALGWLHAHAAEYGGDPDALFAMGHSAGAQLVAWVATDGERLAAAGVPRAALRGVIGLSGVYDVRPHHPVLDQAFGRDQALRAAASPAVHATGEAPPFLLFWGERDLPGLALSGRMLLRRLLERSVPATACELQGRDHVDYVFHIGERQDLVLPRVVQFVHERLGAAPPAATSLAHGTVAAVSEPGALAWLPVGCAPGGWLAVACCGAGACERLRPLGEALATRSIALVAVDCGAADGLRLAEATAGFVAVVRGLQQRHGRELAGAPFVGGLGVGAVVAAGASARSGLAARGLVLFGAPTGLASLREQAPQLAAAPPPPPFGAGHPPCLAIVGDRDPPAVRADGMVLATAVLVAGLGLGVELPGGSCAELLAGAGVGDDAIAPLVLAFVGR